MLLVIAHGAAGLAATASPSGSDWKKSVGDQTRLSSLSVGADGWYQRSRRAK